MQPDGFATPQRNSENPILPGHEGLLDTIPNSHQLLLKYASGLTGWPSQTVPVSPRSLLTRIAADYPAGLGGDPRIGRNDIVVACARQRVGQASCLSRQAGSLTYLARDYPVYIFPTEGLRKAYGFDAN